MIFCLLMIFCTNVAIFMIVYEKNSSMILPRVDDDLMENDDGGDRKSVV